ncbi:MAG TPA: cytochrome c3 family protein [Candidatus Binatia bacterium]|nr:cytochrome c3 family protein [Candidatus Binatia bacterium]
MVSGTRSAVLTLASMMLLPKAAGAVSLETLVMPGPVVAAHADIEKNCRKCHEPFRQQAERGLCLECHDDVRADVEGRRGFHGRVPAAERAECRHCHTEHAGRRAEIVRLDRDAFDHATTDFALVGAHGRVECKDCHQRGEKLRNAPSACNECHVEDDPHRGTLGAECAACHDATSWASTRFDHDDTGFRLIGAHAVTSCASCHPDQHYDGTPTTCADCHRIDDVHRGRRGSKCTDCHGVVSWGRPKFDHDERTEFPLRGRHADASCESCHTGTRLDDPLPRDCQGCHAAEDPHREQLGTRCETCHGETGWRDAVRFDHDLSRFPLVGMHGVVPCEQCHLTPAYADAPTACVDCHEKDDAHGKTLGRACGTCHNPAGWPLWRFDHDRETDFMLDGAHEGLACKGCHVRPPADGEAMETSCVSCHRADDVHRGAYGSDCARCHSTATFAGRKVNP